MTNDYPDKDSGGIVTWQSPSNIALVKYWGKKDGQIPANPSLSMTLSRAYTEMSVRYSPKPGHAEGVELEFRFEGKENPTFYDKIHRYLSGLLPEYPFLQYLRLEIHSRNTFPHSTGIASSASSMSALGLCLATIKNRLKSEPDTSGTFFREASGLARLASGSACRSVYGGYVIWGNAKEIPGSSDEYAIPFPYGIHDSFTNMKDAILVVSSKEKGVSSRTGHGLMENHPFASNRYEMAGRNLSGLVRALQDGDTEEFTRIIEMEAMVLHAMMMSSSPSYMLLEPNTVILVNAIRRFRMESRIPVCFTLDAGPNVHLLYPGRDEKQVREWIDHELVQHCQDSYWIDDQLGPGPRQTD